MGTHLQRILWFIFLVLLQVLVLNHVHIGQYATPLLYVYFILKMRSDATTTSLLLWGFALGICIDLFSNTIGLNASALLWLALLRKPLLRMNSKRDFNEIYTPSQKSMGFTGFLLYISIGTLLCSLPLHIVDNFSFFRFNEILLQAVSSTISSVVCILSLEAIKTEQV